MNILHTVLHAFYGDGYKNLLSTQDLCYKRVKALSIVSTKGFATIITFRFVFKQLLSWLRSGNTDIQSLTELAKTFCHRNNYPNLAQGDYLGSHWEGFLSSRVRSPYLTAPRERKIKPGNRDGTSLLVEISHGEKYMLFLAVRDLCEQGRVEPKLYQNKIPILQLQFSK